MTGAFHRGRGPLLTSIAVLWLLAAGTVAASASVYHLPEGSFNGQEAPGGPFGGVISSDAVDLSNGDVYVAEAPDPLSLPQSRVVKFNREGVYAGVEITGAGTPHGAFAFASLFGSSTSGVAVDNTVAGANRGDLYVADTEHHVLDRFSQSGEFLCQVAGSETEAETPAAKECSGSKGSGLGGAITPGGVAVDASGDVLVTDDGHEAIDEFGPSGEFLSQLKDPHLSNEMRTIALDPSGALYVLNASAFFNASANVLKFEGGHFASVLDSKPSSGFGVDPSTGRVYVSDQITESEKEIVEYEPSGALRDVTSIGPKGFGSIAVGSAGKLYGTESPLFSGGAVAIYSGDLIVPNVTTGAATSVGETTATLGGNVDPDTAHGGGEVTECKFEYGPTEGYGQSARCTGSAPFSGAVSVSLTGLGHSSVYHFRLEAANGDRTPGYGEDGTFTTSGLPTIKADSQVVGGNASLRAQINPYGFDTTCEVQYVTEAGYQRSRYADATRLPCSPADVGSGFGDRTARVTLDGLPIGTTYRYRFLATSQGGVVGAEHTFTTWGVQNASVEVRGEAGEGHPYTQAGGHPYELTTSFEPAWSEDAEGMPYPEVIGHEKDIPTGNPRTVISKLPPGLIGDPSATPKCTRRDLFHEHCSGAAQVGVADLNFTGEPEGFKSGRVGGFTGKQAIYNLVPPEGMAAEFGFNILEHVNIYINVGLRSGEDYGVVAESPNNTILAGVEQIITHFWGIPADPSHDEERECYPGAQPGINHAETPCSLKAGVLKPFLRNPTSCLGPLSTTLAADSWQAPGQFSEASLRLPAMTGCASVPFSPSLAVTPTTNAADSASGLSFDLHLPQPDEANGVSESDLKNTTIAFPAGLTVDPSSADGLAACSEAQAGFTGFAELDPSSEPGVRTPQFTPTPAQCPDASKLGTVEVDTRLVDHPLTGAIYLAKQGENPFGSLLAVYIAIYDPITGVVVKLPGEIKADPQTGQLTTTVDQNPQVPFDDFKINLFEGSRAPLTTPATCGAFTTSSVLSPWSGGAAASPSSSFEVTSAAGGGSCPPTTAQEPMAPSFSAGTFSPIAGTYSPLVVKLGREDGSQQLQSLNVTLPEGLLGKLAGIERCPQAMIEAAQHRSGLGEGRPEQEHPSCSSGSEIGSVRVGAGSGAPFYVTGHAYLAGPYEGAPFSIVAITPAMAGPFDLGTVVVRTALSIDPHTARVTVKSDPFPTMLDGIPLEIRSISVQATRAQFTLNPTSCEKMAVTGTIASTQGVQANVSSPFQVGACNNLPFKPSFTASTSGATSRAHGASLNVKVSANQGEANIAKVDVQLPKQLPSRLTTLQKACADSVFNTNPAACPAGSRVASVVVHTPLLTAPLTGPAYFVSHGGAAFPDLVVVLQSEGVEIMLVGQTEIKSGITYSRFEAVPDAPFTSFELVAPQGPYSIFGANVPASANHSLCGRTLSMPTTLTAQNGLVLKQSTTIAVTGCAKAKGLSRSALLARALRACRHRFKAATGRHRRETCERAARGRYGAKPKRKK
jgi:hypothetical protein